MRHSKCGKSYEVRPDDFRRGRRCPHCVVKKKRKTNEEFLAQVSEATGDEYTFLEEYVLCDTKLRVIHNKCGHEYIVQANAFLQGRRCPKCNESVGEKMVERYLEKQGVQFEKQKSFPSLVYKRPLYYDFYIPTSKTLIEYQGQQHYIPSEFFGGEEEFNVQQARDKIKRNYAKEKGYVLIEIPYTVNTTEKLTSFLENKIL